MTTYQGFDVLEIEPNWRDGMDTTSRRSWIKFDPGIGKVTVEDRNGRQALDQGFSWFAEDRAAVSVLRAFLAARKGAAVPFWLPTWRSDLQLGRDILSNEASFPIAATGFTKFQYPQISRRYIAFIFPDGTKAYRKVTAATDPGDGVSETITIDASLGVAAPSSTLVSFLLLCRLGEDVAKIKWRSQNFAEADLMFTEVPMEVPA